MRHPKRQKKRKNPFLNNHEQESEILPDYFNPARSSLFISGGSAPRFARINGHRNKREEFRFLKSNRNGQSHKSYLKKKLKSKAMEERNLYIKQLLTSDKGKSLLEAIKKKAAVMVSKGEKDKAKICQKIMSKLIRVKKNVKSEVSQVLKMCKLMRERRNINNSIGLLNKESREDATTLLKLKETINKRLRKLKKYEENAFPLDSDDESVSSEECESFMDDQCSEEDPNDRGNLSASVNSSDLDSVDSQSDSESFKDIVTMINNQFKWRMNKLIKYLKKKMEENDSEESEHDVSRFSKKRHSIKNELSENRDNSKHIKQEICEIKKRRDRKAEEKQEEEQEEATENRLTSRFKKEKLSSVVGSFFYNKLQQGKSEGSSPKSSDSSIKIKQEDCGAFV